MDFTVAELTEAISYYEGELGISNMFLKIWDEELDVLPEIPNIGKLEFAETSGLPNDGASIAVVIRIGNRFFRKSGYYSSWGDSTMDGAIEEVKAKRVERTEYEAI